MRNRSVPVIFGSPLVDTIKKNRETLTDTSKEFGLEINGEKTKYKLLSHHQNVCQNRDIKIANRLFEKCHNSNIWWRQSQIKS
jgi:hypothetical protein